MLYAYVYIIRAQSIKILLYFLLQLAHGVIAISF